jgi:hypothetical protein
MNLSTTCIKYAKIEMEFHISWTSTLQYPHIIGEDIFLALNAIH